MTMPVFSNPNLNHELEKHARPKTLKKGTLLFAPGDPIYFIPMVQEGVLRILREDPDGRVIFLYHLYPGQTCAMALNCCQSGLPSQVKAVAEDQTSILQIPVKLVNDWYKFPEWKEFVHQTYNSRFSELLEVIDLIAFSHLDKQLLNYLQKRARANHSRALYITHQQIADELHTHREAISRLLRTMEQKKLVTLGRNMIELLGA